MEKTFRIRFGVSRSDNRKSKIQNPKWGWIVASSVAFALCGAVAQGQQPTKIPRIGYLHAASASDPRVQQQREAFRQGLRERGYIEGRNIAVEYRYAEGDVDRFPTLAAELVHLKVDIIIAPGETAIRAAKQATNMIPIVMVAAGDPITNGFIASLARPGGNITGMSAMSPELHGKRLELLKEAFPRVSRIAFLWNPDTTAGAFHDTQVAAQALGLQLQAVQVRGEIDFDKAFSDIIKKRPDALRVPRDPVITVPKAHQARILDFAAKNRLPAMYDDSQIVEAGGLMSYAPSLIDMYGRAAIYVDKILKGAKPADLPVEQPTKFEFVINLKTAKQIGLTIPPNVLARADKVIR